MSAHRRIRTAAVLALPFLLLAPAAHAVGGTGGTGVAEIKGDAVGVLSCTDAWVEFQTSLTDPPVGERVIATVEYVNCLVY